VRVKRHDAICFLFLFFLSFSEINVFHAFADIIIDNGSPGTSYTGIWAASGGSTPYGSNSLSAHNGATYTWQFDSQPAGLYEVYMWWSGYSTRPTSVAVNIYHRDGIQTVYINQRQNAGQWNSLGQYYFNSNGKVTISAASGSRLATCADAVWFKSISSSAPPTASIDSITPNPAELAEIVEFKGHGTDTDGSIVNYWWESSADGFLADLGSFTTSSLSKGTHAISFRVQDNEGVWSAPATRTLIVENLPTEVAEIVIDNRDATTSMIGTWSLSDGANPYGVDSVSSRNGATFTWNFTPPQSGDYSLSIWWTSYQSRSANIPVDIQTLNGTARVYINQQQNGGKWNFLGIYSFEARKSYEITITAQASRLSTCADAVKFSYINGGDTLPPVNQLPAATIDSITPNLAAVGTKVSFTGHGTDSDGTIIAYHWRSSIDGDLSTTDTFDTSLLSIGTHFIFFKVQDDKGAWSPEVSRAVEIVMALEPVGAEHIYICILYNTKKSDFISLLQQIGAVQEGSVWKYTNLSRDKDYIIHIVEDMESMKEALYTENAHIIVHGHANYGLGGVFATPEELAESRIRDIYYIDDDRIFNYSSPWINVSIYGLIEDQAYPNWWPIFKDGTTGIMPYDFGDPRGDPPYNYYLTYQVPGDPTYYKVETVHNSARERFSDSKRPAWYSPDGTSPDPTNPDHLQYYITNPDTSFESTGKWYQSTGVSGYFGSDYCYAPPGRGDNQARWNFTIPVAGSYSVFSWWPRSTQNASNAPYTVNHASGSSTVTMDQRLNGSRWNKIGEFQFNAGEYSVVLSDVDATGNVVADAIRIVNKIHPLTIQQSIDNLYCPKTHYKKKTILFRKGLDVEIEKMKYSRILIDTCNSGSYYLDTFHRGVMFYSLGSSLGLGASRYLKEYLAGKSDEEIWASMQALDPMYDYYDFRKRPTEQ
jgi:hypothetical protein